jgi:HSP20 family protein
MLTRWNPWTEIASLHRDLDSLFGRFFSQMPQTIGTMTLPAEAVRQDDRWRLAFALPGISPEQIDVEVTGRTVRVRAERGRGMDRPQGEKEGTYVNELAYGRFEREITLPDEVDVEQVKASYRHGMLELVLPLREGARPRKISVTGADPKQLKAA